MGWWSKMLGLSDSAATVQSGAGLLPDYGGVSQALATPWGTSGAPLSRIVVADVWGADVAANLPLSRVDAMGVPAAARARHLLCSDLAAAPLRAMTGADVDEDQPSWLYRTDSYVSPWHRMVWTVDDLIWHGWSLWAVRRGADGLPLDCLRVDYDLWSVDSDGTLVVDGRPVAPDSVILIPGPHEGVLAMARRSLRIARDLEDAVADRAANPVPMVELHGTDDDLSDDEIAELLEAWRAARAKRGGAVAWTPPSIQVNELGTSQDGGAFLVQARNASSIDLVRYIGVPASMVDASNVNASLTYETTTGRNQEYVDKSLALYGGAIAARLSMDDVIPRGRRVAFDYTAFTSTAPTTTGPNQED